MNSSNDKTTPAKQKIGCLYARVSTDELSKVDHGSLEQQKNLGLEFAQQLSNSFGVDYKVKYFLIEEIKNYFFEIEIVKQWQTIKFPF